MKPQPTIYLGGLWHETHSFAVGYTEIEAFEAYKYLTGHEILEHFDGTNTEIGGALEAVGEARAVPVGGLFAGALPSATIRNEVFQTLRNKLLNSLRDLDYDAVFLALHGASKVDGVPDAEGQLLRDTRMLVGPNVPIAVVVDLHANLSPEVVGHADIIIAYDTYPHTDFAVRGHEATMLLMRALDGERFSRVLVQLPMIPPLTGQGTKDQPMADLIRAAHAAEQQSGIEVVSWTPGYPFTDESRMGMCLSVVASGKYAQQLESLRSLALDMAREAWRRRNEFFRLMMSVDDAVEQAIQSLSNPVILVDVADNVGGGSPGDGTAILEKLVERRVRGSVVAIADPESVYRIADVGVGARISFEIGGKTDRAHGRPVPFEGEVKWFGPGAYTLSGPWMRGLTLDPGLTARVENDDGVTVVINERKVPPFDAGQLLKVGIQPERCSVIVVKSAIAWRAAFGDVAAKSIDVDTPGICTPHLEHLPYRNRRSPLWPVEHASFEDTKVHVFAPRKFSRS